MIMGFLYVTVTHLLLGARADKQLYRVTCLGITLLQMSKGKVAVDA